MPMHPLSGGDDVDARRRIPATDILLALPELAAAVDRLGRQAVKHVVSAVQERARRGEIWLPSSGWRAYSGCCDPSSMHTNHVHLSMY